ncbi:SBP domain [Dillenia turbinata]|uniref:SBP domain n=1 Tax=Dillenia turbinata TaxID=194707 RepID=A0AAN8ZIH4_9MAGN
MEEAGPQVATPIFIHQKLSGRFCDGPPTMPTKRDLPLPYHNQLPPRQQPPNHRFGSGYQIPMDGWNPNHWNWDSVMMLARPLDGGDALRLGGSGSSPAPATSAQVDQRMGLDDTITRTTHVASSKARLEEDDENLKLKLGGALNSVVAAAEPASTRPSKRVRSGSPGGTNFPMCQVDDCKSNLSNAKDYHRRHKVCEAHSKSTKALVGKQMQRFCQQCSRFHSLSEFDEGKRSCRRRLAGHNRRRRKTQPEDVQYVVPGGADDHANGNLDIVNLLSALTRSQGNKEDMSIHPSSSPKKEQLIQILQKLNSSLPAEVTAKLPNANMNILPQASFGHRNKNSGNASCQSTADLLAVLSSTLAASAPDALDILSQRSCQSSESEKTRSTFQNQCNGFNMKTKAIPVSAAIGGERSSTSCHSPGEDLDCHVEETQINLPLQLFTSSPEDDSRPKVASTRKYFCSDSSNPVEERSPSSSPHVVQNLFPFQSSSKTNNHERIFRTRKESANVEASRIHGCNMPLELFGGESRRSENVSSPSMAYKGGYTSSSGSDHSPSSLNSDAQDRTGRIMFKLFDKDPSHFPQTLRSQIYNWLSRSPSEMESYIRPGCVVLSIYASMPSAAWEQLEGNLFEHINSLVHNSKSDFWRHGRFLVRVGRQLALHDDGKIRLSRSWRTSSAPELISVFPLAVVGGQQTSLTIHRAYMGQYVTEEVTGLSFKSTLFDEISLGNFTFHGSHPGSLGRCFIEVENGIRGNSFPVIVADSAVCRELRLLEQEFDEGMEIKDCLDKFGHPKSTEEILHFLNELGWLFQRKSITKFEGSDYSITRFKFLLTYSVERDYCALVKTLLDILADLRRVDLSNESLKMLQEVHLLNRAVKRRSRNMVDLLLHYFVTSSDGTSKKYIFAPNAAGPGGITPLHLTASISGSDDIVDALTSDPQEIGLQCWNSLLDANGQSPHAYALMRSNDSYNSMVARKLADRKNAQISLSIEDVVQQERVVGNHCHGQKSQSKQGFMSCSNCAAVATKYDRGVLGSPGMLYRPFVHSMLAIAAVCVCVCLFLRGSPNTGCQIPFKWENLHYGTK